MADFDVRAGKNVLVTGANGFIGRETVRTLKAQGWNVFRGIRNPLHENDIPINFEAPGFVCDLLRHRPVDAIVHLAARVGLDGYTLADQFVPNVAAVSALLTVAKLWNSKFIFASTASRGGKGVSGDVGTSAIPDHPYARSKWLSEQLVSASGIPSAILRIGGVYGLRGPGHLGLNRAIEAACCGRRPVLVGNGLARRNYIYVKDVATNIAFTLKHGICGTHVVAGTESLSITEMLDCVCDVFLPGQIPDREVGDQGVDQIFKPSTAFPSARPFRAALEDIRADWQTLQ